MSACIQQVPGRRLRANTGHSTTGHPTLGGDTRVTVHVEKLATTFAVW